MTNPYTPAGRTAPKWARKRYVLPALGLAFFIGIGASGEDSSAKGDAKPLAAKAQPAATVTATVTATPSAAPEPAPTVTVTETETAKVKVKVTRTAEPVEEDYSGGGGGGGSVYYENCSAARAAGAAPVHVGDPGYGSHLDRDGDGTGCE
ncbi:excalibur calcium-binding domain-containing protein [Streptomyces albogriseolus]|uniref:excalibur calcium-binding domain-containing protein n=1 Tax=Streptomyces albogriseolus TaxID=1887 RepID=UPI00346129C4